jgi:hypothetical protein
VDDGASLEAALAQVKRGNQSFATVFLNENGDGAVMSSLFTRDRVSVFSKSLKNFISEHGMSDEEKEALIQAKRKLEV